MMTILYLHGFNSSPQSFKARQLQQLMAALGLSEYLLVPELDNDPAQASIQIDALIQTLQRPLLVGSSMGGYYATYFAEKYGLKAILINPAVSPQRLCAERLGPQKNYHSGQTWELTMAHVDALARLQTAAPSDPERFQVWLQTGDETLDYRDAEAFYRHCALRIEAGGDHGFAGFSGWLAALLSFAGVPYAHWRDFDFSTLN